MRWEEERYVRVYTRDTADWLALSWDAQGLFLQLLRKADRAGLIPLGRQGKRAVAMVLLRMDIWESRLAPALEELINDGCVRIDGDSLFIPNYVEAQEAKMTAAERKRRQRDRDRLGDGEIQDGQDVTRDSVNVTRVTPVTQEKSACHVSQMSPQPSLAEPAVLSRTEPSQPRVTPPEPWALKQQPTVQGGFYLWFNDARRRALGEDFIEDREWNSVLINRELAWVTELDEDLISEAAHLYLQDPKRRKQDPPCSLLWFSKDRGFYLSRAKKVLGEG
jgi:hypothetical protein